MNKDVVQQKKDFLLTALAPAIWGSSYLTITELLPKGFPLTVAMLRALPAGLVLLLLVRRLPDRLWLGRVVVLGALNISIFGAMLFIAANRLPGGVAATLVATQPLLVLVLARLVLDTSISPARLMAAIGGIAGVALLVLGHGAAMDPIGMAAAVTGALSMAAGTVLTYKWKPEVSPLTITAWQLTAGGVLLLPVALWCEPNFPALTPKIFWGVLWLSLVGSAITYPFWFRGIARLDPPTVTVLTFLSPVSATFLGWLVLGQRLTPVQEAGMLIVFASIWSGQRR